MPYSEQDHDRALARLAHDARIYRDDPPAPRGATGTVLCLALLMFILGLFVLLSAGCNTIAGAAADIEAAARGTQEYLARDPQAP